MEYVLIYTDIKGENKVLSFEDRAIPDALLAAITTQTRSGHVVKLGDDYISSGTVSLAMVAEVVAIDHEVDNAGEIQQQIRVHEGARAAAANGGSVPQVAGFGPVANGGGDQSPAATSTKETQPKSQG